MELNASSAKYIMDNIDTFLFDCDGVLWNGPHLIDGAIDLINHLININKRVIVISNNSSKSRREYYEKFQRIGATGITKDNIVGTAVVLADYIKRNLNLCGKVYIVGMEGIAEELAEMEIPFYLPEAETPVSLSQLQQKRAEIEFKKDVGAVVVGISLGFNYQHLSEAGFYLKNPDCHFLAANDDISYPVRPGLHLPGAGVIIAAIKATSCREPMAVVGKPNTAIIDYVIRNYGIKGIVAERCIMVGDKVDTDIVFANRLGCKSLLVYSGVTPRGFIGGARDTSPTYTADSVKDLLNLVK